VTTIWAWCLVFVISGQQPIVQFDYKTEADCNASIVAVKAQQPDMQSQSWCVPIVKPELKRKSAVRPKAKRRSVRSVKR
jgi:hypothetical protein